MRLHRLEMTAFGPFGDTVSVDFEELSTASLFLLCGDTGAGKSTVLDGVCFALYGEVPGRRGSAKQLRSQHASPDAVPRVELEMSIGDRHFRFTRQPLWWRPKRRGHGVTREQARVRVEELVEGAWELRTGRLDEAGHLVTDLVGMTLAQFSQVVLLPQGEFDTFLRSSSEERQQVLTRLFDTGRFEQVERWFADRRRDLWREHCRHQAAAAGVVHRLCEASGVETPEEWDPADLTAPADDGTLREWATELAESGDRTVGGRVRCLQEAADALRAASSALESGQRLTEQQRRWRAAERGRQQLAESTAAAEATAARLDRDRRAAGVLPLLSVRDRATADLASASSAARAAVVDLAELLGTSADSVPLDALSDRERDAAARLASARAFLPRAQELRSATAQAEQLRGDCDRLARTVTADQERLDALPDRRAAVAAALDRHRSVAAQAPAREERVRQLTHRLRSAESVAELTVELTGARAAEDTQRLVVAGLKEQWLELKERRLDGMAAELATGLAVGHGCPVCGSADHPAPARAAADAPTREDEQAALKSYEDAQAILEVHRDHVRGLSTRIDTAQDSAGARSPGELAAELGTARDELAEAVAAAELVAELEQELAALDEEVTRLAAAVATGRADLRASGQRADELSGTVARLTGELAQILGDEDQHLEDVIAGHEALCEALAAAREALAEQQRCSQRADEAERRLEEAARRAGFTHSTEAASAELDEHTRVAFERERREREQLAREVESVLADDELRAAGAADPPDLECLDLVRREADSAHTAAAAALQIAERTRDRIRARCAELDEALTAWAPVRTDHALVRSLAELVEGKGPENTRQMRLSAYVLAARLGQVVAAANERLVRMVDHRYLLEHSYQPAVGDRRGGLSLRVRDQWTDELRDPVTLSGGETFVVSLALALGLADVVTAESGGTHIDTLFVDEGFGSLDADTLELVMDTLDQLREGGRAVGVVSHVAEMRSRIPTQLEVLKGRAGSTLRLVPATH